MEYTDVHELLDAYVLCRTLGHSWDDNPTATVDSELFRMSTGCLTLRCVRCTTERFDYLANDLTVFQRYYRYPDKYRTVPGVAKRPVLRAEMLRRALLIRTTKKRR